MLKMMGTVSSVYLVSQLLAAAAIVSLGLSYLCRDKQAVLILCVVYAVLYGGQYLLLGAMTGAAMSAVSILRNIWFFLNARAGRKNGAGVFLILCLTAAASTAVTYDGPVSLVPLCATVLFTYSIWQDNVTVYKWLALPVSAGWIFYNIAAGSVMGTVAEFFLLAFELAGLAMTRAGK